MQERKQRRLLVLDVALAVLFFAVCAYELSHRLEDGPYIGSRLTALAVDAVFCATLMLRRTYPRTCLVAINVVWLGASLLTWHTPLFFGNYLPMLLVAYTAARYTTGAAARWGWVTGLVFWLGMLPHVGEHLNLVANPLLPVGGGLLAWFIGTVLRRFTEQREEVAAAYAALEKEQAGRELRAAERERARIAADMHDTVAHAVSLMVVQVGNARMALERSSKQDGLRRAERTGRDALVELRRSLGVLRGSHGPVGGALVPPPDERRGETNAPRRPRAAWRSFTGLSRRVPPMAWDTVLAVALAAVAVLESLDLTIDDGFRTGPAWLNATLGVATCLPLAWRRRSPLATYAAMLAVVVLPGLFVGHSLFLYGTLVPLCIACFTLSRHDDSWPARTTWSAGIVLSLVGGLHTPHAAEMVNVIFSLVFTGTACITGRTVRRFEVQRAELRRTLLTLAEEQADREGAAVDDERNRIAAEMHDVVAHAVSSMVVQVGATRMEGGPPEEMAKLRDAEEAGRQALSELRTTLGLLRSGDDAALRPLPGIDGVGALVTSLRAAGLDVSLDLELSGELSESISLTAYRILQEALTNALKHGGRGEVWAVVRVSTDRVVVRVENPLGRASTDLPSGGHGLAGMRERVALFAGSLDAGVRGDRYVVEAILRVVDEPVPV